MSTPAVTNPHHPLASATPGMYDGDETPASPASDMHRRFHRMRTGTRRAGRGITAWLPPRRRCGCSLDIDLNAFDRSAGERETPATFHAATTRRTTSRAFGCRLDLLDHPSRRGARLPAPIGTYYKLYSILEQDLCEMSTRRATALGAWAARSKRRSRAQAWCARRFRRSSAALACPTGARVGRIQSNSVIALSRALGVSSFGSSAAARSKNRSARGS